MSEVSPHNGLTLAEEEMLTITIEECSEVIKACTKIKRHGRYARNREGILNSDSLREEAADVLACFGVLAKNGFLSAEQLNEQALDKLVLLKSTDQRRVYHITPDMLP